MKYSNMYESNAKAPYVYDFVYNQTTLLSSDYYQEHNYFNNSILQRKREKCVVTMLIFYHVIFLLVNNPNVQRSPLKLSQKCIKNLVFGFVFFLTHDSFIFK